MARPISTGKQSVNLASNLASAGPRVSRIRRDPPPAVKETVVPDRDERDRWTVAVGILIFTLAILAIIAGFSSVSGWSPREQVIHIHIE